MQVKVLYFASLRERVGRADETLVLPAGVTTVGELRQHLASRGTGWEALGPGRNVRAARNQAMAAEGEALAGGDEIAFFPPVTGG